MKVFRLETFLLNGKINRNETNIDILLRIKNYGPGLTPKMCVFIFETIINLWKCMYLFTAQLIAADHFTFIDDIIMSLS